MVGKRVAVIVSDEKDKTYYGTTCEDASGREYVLFDDGISYYPTKADIVREISGKS